MSDNSWTLDRLPERLQWWESQFNPSTDLVILVLAWVMGLKDDPFPREVRRTDFADQWFGAVPNSGDGQGNVVTCSYWVDHDTRTIRFDMFSTSTWPV